MRHNELDFDLSGRVKRLNDKRERQERANARRRAFEQQRRMKAAQDARNLQMKIEEQRRQDRRKERREKREKKVQEALELKRNGGIELDTSLIPYPTSNSNSNRVILPPAVLSQLVVEGVLDRAESRQHQPVTFHLSLINESDGGSVVGETCCGVNEFSAEDGFIGKRFLAKD